MQKLKEKKILGTVPKNYQRVENFWDCPEFSRKQQNQRGITLIALIITIIVMLILVGVTINVALNGGLFEKAKDAKEKTAAATEKEQLLNAVFATLDDNGKIHLDNIELPEGFKEVPSDDDTKVVYKGPSGKQYEVSRSTGVITEMKEDNGDSDEDDDGAADLGQYYLKYLQAVSGMIDPSEFTEDEKTAYLEEIEMLEEQGLIYTFENETDISGDYHEYYLSINGYNYYYIFDDRGEYIVSSVSLIAKDSNDYNKVNSLVEESKNLEEELLLIGAGYTFNTVDTEEIETYISNNLSGNRTVEVISWAPQQLKLSTYSTVDSTVLLEFYIDYSYQSPHRPTNIKNDNKTLF